MKSTKKSLLLSALSLTVSVMLLIGTTFAWFTDSVTSGRNTIKAGNLDIELTHSNAKVTNQPVKDATDLFGIALWEPGVIAYENFTVFNKGNLALKYALNLNVFDKNKTTEDHDLTEVIKVAFVTDGFTATGNPIVDRATAQAITTFESLKDFQKTGNLAGGDTTGDTFGVVLYWEPTEDDNLYNLKNGLESDDGQPLFVEFGVNLVATQDTVESDSFGTDYDLSANLPVIASFPTIKKADLTTDKSVKIEEKGAVKSAEVPAKGAADVFTDLKEDEAAFDNDLTLTLNITETANEEKEMTGGTEKIIDLDINMSAVMVSTNVVTKEIKTQKKEKVETLTEFTTIEMNVGVGYASVTAFHKGIVMEELSSATATPTDTANGGYFYKPETGVLTLKTMTFSPFTLRCVSVCEHDFKVTETVPATCCRDGKHTLVCSKCDFVAYEEIPMTGKCNCSQEHSDEILGVWCNYCHHVVPFIEGPYTAEDLAAIPNEYWSGTTVMYPIPTDSGGYNIVEVPTEYMYFGYCNGETIVLPGLSSGKYAAPVVPAVLYIFKTFPDGGDGHNYIDSVTYREDVDEDGNTVYIEDQSGTETKESIMMKYINWKADYVISFDQDIDLCSCGIVGAYGGMAFGVDMPGMKVGDEVGLLATMGEERTYGQIAEGEERNFVCGFYNLSSDNIGKKIIVKLMLTDPNDPDNKVLCSYTEYEVTEDSYTTVHPSLED